MLEAGEVGWVSATIKDIHGAPVGDTLTHAKTPDVEMLPGFKKVKPQVYAGMFPVNADDYEDFRDALSKLALNPSAFRFPALELVFTGLVGFVVAVLYLGGCWSVSGRTVGAAIMGLQVLGRHSDRLKPPAAFLRGAACVAFPLGLAWVALDQHRRSLQDNVFGSRVVYVHPC